MAEAFWPDGLQPGQGRPVVLELDLDLAKLPRLEALGYEVFTTVDALLEYVDRRSELASGAADSDSRARWDTSPASEGGTEQPGSGQSGSGRPDAQQPGGERHGAEQLAAEFERAIRAIVVSARDEAHYTPAYVAEPGIEWSGLATARRLLRSAAMSDWFASLWERGRLDLTVEALVLQPRFAGLFTDAETDMARHRLEPFGYL